MDLFKNNIVGGIGVALAAAILAPVLLPAASRLGRPLTKSLVRGGMALYEKGRETMAIAGESVEDIMAEIRAENNTRATAAQRPPPAPQQTEAGVNDAVHVPPSVARHDGQGGAAQ